MAPLRIWTRTAWLLLTCNGCIIGDSLHSNPQVYALQICTFDSTRNIIKHLQERWAHAFHFLNETYVHDLNCEGNELEISLSGWFVESRAILLYRKRDSDQLSAPTRGERDSLKLEVRREPWSDYSLPLVRFSLPFITKHGMWFAPVCSSPPRIPNPQHVEHQNCGRSFEARQASFSILKPSDPGIGHFRILVWLPFHLVHRIAIPTVFNPPSSMLTPSKTLDLHQLWRERADPVPETMRMLPSIVEDLWQRTKRLLVMRRSSSLPVRADGR